MSTADPTTTSIEDSNAEKAHLRAEIARLTGELTAAWRAITQPWRAITQPLDRLPRSFWAESSEARAGESLSVEIAATTRALAATIAERAQLRGENDRLSRALAAAFTNEEVLTAEVGYLRAEVSRLSRELADAHANLGRDPEGP